MALCSNEVPGVGTHDRLCRPWGPEGGLGMAPRIQEDPRLMWCHPETTPTPPLAGSPLTRGRHFRPRIGVRGAGLMTAGPRDIDPLPTQRESTTVGTLQVNWPIFDSGLTRARVRQVRQDEEQAALQQQQIELGISLEVRQAVANLQNAVAQIDSLIAQHPAAERSASRLLHLDGRTGALADRRFTDIVGLLGPGDVLVVNDTRVIPARIRVQRETGGAAEAIDRLAGIVARPSGD